MANTNMCFNALRFQNIQAELCQAQVKLGLAKLALTKKEIEAYLL